MEGIKKEEIPPVVAKQIIKVSETGAADMLHCSMVQGVAVRNDWYELAEYLSDEENWEAYIRFVIIGETEPEKSYGQ